MDFFILLYFYVIYQAFVPFGKYLNKSCVFFNVSVIW